MKRPLSIVFALTGWFAIISQYYLMLNNSSLPLMEVTVRFFSYFTILTNSLVALYFTTLVLKSDQETDSIVGKPGTLTAITAYITIVGLVYQVVLRSLWNPDGLQKVVDELLHSVIPVMVILYWFMYEKASLVRYGQIKGWLIYPLLYLGYILLRGNFSDFYPYPFVDVTKLGMTGVLFNSLLLLVLFSGMSALFVWTGRALNRK